MFFFDFKSLGVRKLICKKKFFEKKEISIIFKKIIIKNEKKDKSLAYKLHVKKKKYESITNQASVCLLTGRHRSVINECGFKRQIFKRTLMQNKITFIKKKSLV